MSRAQGRRKSKHAVAIVGEGITERIYFTQLRQFERLGFELKPSLPKNSSNKEIVKKANELLNEGFDHVFCLFDLDEINRDATIKKQYSKLKTDNNEDRITFIENNPCMEFWFLLHHLRTNRKFDNYGQLERLLKKHIPDYKKTERYLTTKNIYTHLKETQATAIENAGHSIKHATPTSSKSEVHLILDYLNVTTNDQ